jgi:hypothetical protein
LARGKIITIINLHFPRAFIVIAMEAAGIKDFTATEDATSASTVVSSHASYCSLELLRMITLPSLSGLRR